jgi:hypothetical protein
MVEHRPVRRANAVGLSDLFLAEGPWRPYSMVDAQRRARQQLRYGARTPDASIGRTVGDSTSRRSTQVTSSERGPIRAAASSRSPTDAVANVRGG